MEVSTLTAEISRRLGIESDSTGVVVSNVEPGGVAERVGLQPGDLVKSIDGTVVNSVEDFREILRNRQPEDGIRMQIERDGARRFVFLKRR